MTNLRRFHYNILPILHRAILHRGILFAVFFKVLQRSVIACAEDKQPKSNAYENEDTPVRNDDSPGSRLHGV